MESAICNLQFRESPFGDETPCFGLESRQRAGVDGGDRNIQSERLARLTGNRLRHRAGVIAGQPDFDRQRRQRVAIQAVLAGHHTLASAATSKCETMSSGIAIALIVCCGPLRTQAMVSAPVAMRSAPRVTAQVYDIDRARIAAILIRTSNSSSNRS